MNIPEGCKPFNLEAALAGAKTICRDGSPGPVEFHVVPEWYAPINKRLLVRFANGGWGHRNMDGTFLDNGIPSFFDLFMAPVEKEITAWAVVDKDGDDMGEYFASQGGASAAIDNYHCRYSTLAPFSIVELAGKWKG